MEDAFTDSLPSSPSPEVPVLTVSPADTSLQAEDVEVEMDSQDKPPSTVCTTTSLKRTMQPTNACNRKRAKTDDEKEQRRIERVLRNRAAAQTSRERKRLEMEKLENEKVDMEQQNQFLLQRLSQMEAENNRLSQQVAQLSAEIRGSRHTTPMASSPASVSPTLTPTLFKQEGDEIPLDRIPFPTPSVTDYSPTLKPSSLAESSDLTQHPAAMLCDLQCQSVDSKETAAPLRFLTSEPQSNTSLQTTLQLLFLTMTSAAYSTVIHPLSQILLSLKMGSPLTFSTQEIYRHSHLILWLILTPSLSPSKTSSSPTAFRIKLLARLLACNPAMARPLRDATGRALQLAVRERFCQEDRSVSGVAGGRWSWESLLTVESAINLLEKPERRRRTLNGLKSLESGRRNVLGKRFRVTRSLRSSATNPARR
ncbi:transcription factor HAC1 [Aspergillus stella-maris]|uniref:transcription factor HAC1 n=1 Tax=Aspergillus stella-maris TaxID=1810926 RepID=UPI003CCCC620